MSSGKIQTIEAQVSIPAAVFLSSADVLRKAAEDSPSIWVPDTHAGDLDAASAPGFALAKFWPLKPSVG